MTTWNGYTKGTGDFTRILIAMFCAGIVTFAQLYPPQALLPAIARDLAVDPASSALTISCTTMGMATFAIFWTYIADRIGKSRAMFAAVILATTLGLIAPWAGSFPLMLALRFSEGAMLAGIAAVAVAFIAEEANAKDAGAAAGLYISGTSLGGLIGRVTAAPIAELTGSWRWGMMGVSLLAAIAGILFITLLPRARRFTPVPKDGAVRETIHRLAANFKSRRLRALYLIAFVLMGSFVTVFNYVGFILEQPPFNLSQTASALIFFTFLTGTVASSRAGIEVAKRGAIPVMAVALIIFAAGIALTFIPNLILVIIGLALVTIGFFSCHSVAAALTGVRAREGKAQATALYNVFYYAGGAFVGWIGGYFFAAGGWLLTGSLCIGLLLILGMVALRVLTKLDAAE